MKKTLGYIIISIGILLFLFQIAIYIGIETPKNSSLFLNFWILIQMFVPFIISLLCFKIGIELTITKN